MSSEMPAPNADNATTGRFGPDGRDRRRRHRAKITLPVHIRGGMGSSDPFEDHGTTIDASCDGLLVATNRRGYWDGELLEVTFASVDKPMPWGEFQRARVVRTVLMPNQPFYGVGLGKRGEQARFEQCFHGRPRAGRRVRSTGGECHARALRAGWL